MNLPHRTRHDLPAAARARVADELHARLLDVLDLAADYRQAHWNVRGPQFLMLHELFERLGEELEEPTDDLAERVAQFGGTVSAGVRDVAAGSSLAPWPAALVDGPGHLSALADRVADLAKKTRAAIDAAAAAGDADTADLFTGLSRLLDKHLWLLEAHGQA